MTFKKPLTLHLPRQRQLTLAEPVIMGILNVTPDSFSDGGQHCDPCSAVRYALDMVHDGASIIDIGGESTRPGSERVHVDEQIRRTVPVIRKLRQADSQVVISIDTTHSQVAQAAMDAGADMINDISAGEEDPRLLELAGNYELPIVLMHKQGMPATMQDQPDYVDVVKQVFDYLKQRAQAAIQAGNRSGQIILDPGIGFGKTVEHNMALLASLEQLTSSNYPVLLGTSRKSSLRSACTLPAQPAPEPHELVGATCATTALGVAAGVQIFRVHDVQANWQAMRVATAIRRAR
jgi:dihydropteroate synthase